MKNMSTLYQHHSSTRTGSYNFSATPISRLCVDGDVRRFHETEARTHAAYGWRRFTGRLSTARAAAPSGALDCRSSPSAFVAAMVDWSRYQLVSSPCAHLTFAIDYPDVHLYLCVPMSNESLVARDF